MYRLDILFETVPVLLYVAIRCHPKYFTPSNIKCTDLTFDRYIYFLRGL